MTEDNRPTVSSSDSNFCADSSTAKRRRKRKWDEPAMPLVSAGLALPISLPSVNGVLSNVGIALPGVAPVSGAIIGTPLAANRATWLPGIQAPVQPHAVALAQKPKIQEELIAREIVINDADSAIRYKLTKRQTQEEIQRCTGAVVITRGKYKPPSAPHDGEKPLYLHISAGSHLESTVDRIKAVDRAASMVEEMLKPGSVSNGLKGNLLSTCVYLGFEANPSLNIAARIRGPNDQFINHITNETGATVLVRGRGSGSESAQGEEGQQPLHLFLSSNNPKSLEQAKLLAENLLDTISAECGTSRISSSKVYGAVPPPPQLLTDVEIDSKGSSSLQTSSSSVSVIGSLPSYSAVASPGLNGVSPVGTVSPSAGSFSSLPSQPVAGIYSHPLVSGGTSYNAYAGLYPQATPLQQVALALKQSSSPVTATIASVTTAAHVASHTSAGPSTEVEKRPQRRKFQELPVAGIVAPTSLQNSLQESNVQSTCQLTPDVGARDGFRVPPPKYVDRPSANGSMMAPPKNLVQQSSDGMPSPPPKMVPPPPKFNTMSSRVHENKKSPNITIPESVPDTLVKLLEYGDDDDDE